MNSGNRTVGVSRAKPWPRAVQSVLQKCGQCLGGNHLHDGEVAIKKTVVEVHYGTKLTYQELI